MHAYLITGNNEEGIADRVEKLAKKLGAKIMEFPLKKIEDTRELGKFTALKLTEPTAININSIETATTEAQNSFLKNLEEPQENLYYILTAQSLIKVMPTITSRCEVVKLKNLRTEEIKNDGAGRFLEMTVGEKLAYCDNIKGREEAKVFVGKIINYFHELITLAPNNPLNLATNLETASSSLRNLEANGNVNLQLTYMIINLV
ncbi:MAG: hypothetical protein Q8P91_03555 [bacterium]|nr:hypothetical protein [bacterium]